MKTHFTALRSCALVALILAAPVMSGCATTGSTYYDPAVPKLFNIYLTMPLETIEAYADNNLAQYQYGLSLMHQYGLRGKEKDPVRAKQYRDLAFAKRGDKLQHYYSSAGSSSVTVPVHEPVVGHIHMMDKCAAALDAGRNDVEAVHQCYAAPNHNELIELWAKAKSE